MSFQGNQHINIPNYWKLHFETIYKERKAWKKI